MPSQTALTLRAVGGLTTAEIAKAFFVPEATMAQRISRAKQKVKGARFTLPPEEERDERRVARRAERRGEASGGPDGPGGTDVPGGTGPR